MEEVLLSNGCATLSVVGEVYYDYPNLQQRTDTSFSENGENFQFSLWQFYGKQMQFLYDHNTQKCSAYSMNNATMTSPVIPDTSVYVGEFLIGSQAVDAWTVVLPNFMGTLSVTSDTCFLVSQIGLNGTSGTVTYLMNAQDFFPAVPMYIFEMPSACTDDKLVLNSASGAKKKLNSLFDLGFLASQN